MPRKKKVVEAQAEKPTTDYEQFLINKIDRCQRIADGLRDNKVWLEIKADYENTAKGLDLAWAFEDVTSPRFKQMQAAKMAATTFLNMQQNYEHDLKLAREELAKFQNPNKVIKKDFDEEGIEPATKGTSTLQETAYHGR